MKTLSIILNTILVCVLVFLLATLGLPSGAVKAAERNSALAESAPVCDSSRTVHVS